MEAWRRWQSVGLQPEAQAEAHIYEAQSLYPLGLKGRKFLLPRGLISGQKLGRILRERMLPVAEVTDFDRLPVPFRAVATDLEDGERVVLGSGDLFTPHNEHRILFTRLLDLGVIWLNGGWSPLLQMTVNAFLHAGFACALAYGLWVFLGRKNGWLICLLLASRASTR